MSGYWDDLVVTLVVGIGALVWVLWQRRHPRIWPEHIAEARRQAHETVAALTPDDWPDTDERIRATDEEQWQDQALDVIAEPDQRRAEHMNRTLRRAEGGDET